MILELIMLGKDKSVVWFFLYWIYVRKVLLGICGDDAERFVCCSFGVFF